MKLVDRKLCTSCGACVAACAKGCIQMQHDTMDVTYPCIDETNCVECGRCENVCHIRKSFTHDMSNEVYAAWNTDDSIRKTSASGGIASALYSMGLEKGWISYGVQYIPRVGAHYVEIKGKADIEHCRNSKYLYCDCTDIYSQIKTHLNGGKTVLFIGIPCQVAAIKSYLGKQYETLITVDILCHGTAPEEYFNQHIEAIEKRKNRKAKQVFFRDPRFGTSKYRLTLYDNALFYNAGVYENDVYQIGYHKSLILKENCYQCKYAKRERVGDLTISDFSGLGKIGAWRNSKESVSSVVVSTGAGKQVFEDLVRCGYIVAEMRPSDEAFLYDNMFQQPSIPHPRRSEFVEIYKATHSFEKSARKCLRKEIVSNIVFEKFHLKYVKKIAQRLMGPR